MHNYHIIYLRVFTQKLVSVSYFADKIVILGDFAENYSFVVQDEIQSYHWNSQQCSLHPLVVYYKDNNGELQHSSYCYISDDITHDVAFVYEVIKQTVSEIKSTFLELEKVILFTDGCAGQYKICKSLYNFCEIENEFGIKAEWNFFATSHGKSPCDGIGGTVKRLTSLESLKRPYRDQILNSRDMFGFCDKQMPSISFKYIKSKELKVLRESHQTRYLGVTTIPGTRSFHQFCQLDRNQIGAKRCSNDTDFTIVHQFKKQDVETVNETVNASTGDYVAVVFDTAWWVGLITEVNTEECDVKVRFLHPNGPAAYFKWPEREDCLYVPDNHILTKISVPQLGSSSGRNYSLSSTDLKSVVKCWEKYCDKNNV